jgi:hypothetical protein
MSKIFGFVVGAIWVGFAFWAYSISRAGWAEGHSDLGFWWTVIGVFYSIAAGAALVGTARHRRTGPRK